jgi:hypothetical protein
MVGGIDLPIAGNFALVEPSALEEIKKSGFVEKVKKAEVILFLDCTPLTGRRVKECSECYGGPEID